MIKLFTLINCERLFPAAAAAVAAAGAELPFPAK